MAQKVWEIIEEDTGVVKISLTADSTAMGVTISNSPNWQSISDIEHIVTLLSVASQWLIANEGI